MFLFIVMLVDKEVEIYYFVIYYLFTIGLFSYLVGEFW